MKKITIRIEDDLYSMLKKAANGEKRTLSNLIEYAAFNYITGENLISDTEMDEILDDKALVENLRNGQNDIKEGRYKIVG